MSDSENNTDLEKRVNDLEKTVELLRQQIAEMPAKIQRDIAQAASRRW